MADQKVSALIYQQVPEYVREEYPVFISFLEAYYEFLETKQGTQKNDLMAQAKDLRYITDVDDSIDDFEKNFFETFAYLLPRDVSVDKSFLIKNLLPLYLSKGSENSFKFLFRLLFGQELEIKYPKNDILRASDGKWQIDNALKVSNEINSIHTGDGTTKTFKLLGQFDANEITVYINGSVTTAFLVRKETKKIVFNSAPANAAKIEVFYPTTLDRNLFVNRLITGETSGTTALVEKVSTKIVNNEFINELYINTKTLDGTFINGENVNLTVYDDVDEIFIPVHLNTVSNLLRINILDGGANYNVGDPVIVNAPIADSIPSAIVTRTFKGTINQVIVNDGGAGFQIASRIAAVGFANTEIDFAIATVDTAGTNTVNVFTVFTDVISDVDPANTLLSATDWHFPSNTAGANLTVSVPAATNVNTVIAHAFANSSYTSIGEIRTVTITANNLIVSTTPTLNAEPAILNLAAQTANTAGFSEIKIDTYGSLGKLVIQTGGENYLVGDEIQFINQSMSFGTGASAEVMNVSSIGRIINVDFVPSKITGTANVTSASNVMVHGIGTSFTTDLTVGDEIMISRETRRVVKIVSDTSLNVNTSFSQISLGVPVRKWGKDLLGGQGYTQDKLPIANVVTSNGTGAVVVVSAIMGDGEDLTARGTKRPGEIEEITITNPGSGIKVIPQIILTGYGDGTAVANSTLTPSYETYEGRWTTSDGILSSADRKIQGRDYYVDYSYLTSSTVEFAKYKKIFKELIHPAGFRAYGEITKLDVFETSTATLDTIVAPITIKTLSGKVNIANASIIVTGTGTKFNVANTLRTITIGSYIAVNSEIRLVNNIISNTQLTVSSPFTITANGQELVVMNTVYDAIATEVTLEEITAENELSLITQS
jgi:hypothetical protein